jgi:hypothetical protein
LEQAASDRARAAPNSSGRVSMVALVLDDQAARRNAGEFVPVGAAFLSSRSKSICSRRKAFADAEIARQPQVRLRQPARSRSARLPAARARFPYRRRLLPPECRCRSEILTQDRARMDVVQQALVLSDSPRSGHRPRLRQTSET